MYGGSAPTLLLDDVQSSPRQRDSTPSRCSGRASGCESGRPRKVRFTAAPELADLLMERKVHPSQVAQLRSDGSVEVRLEVAVGPPLVAYLTGLGAAVSEIQPRELREAVVREHRGALGGLG